jgi:cell division protein FtsQ
MIDNLSPKENITQRRRPSRWSIALLASLLLGVAVVVVLALQWRETLKVQRVIVEGVTTLSAKEIVALAKVSPQAVLYSMDLEEIRDRVLHHPFVRAVDVSRQYPNKLTVNVVEREPVATINCGQLCYVDEEGMLLPCNGSNKKFDLPLISGIEGVENVKSGKMVMSKEMFEAIDVCQTARSLDTGVYRMISEINMNNGGDIILYSSEAGIPVVVGRGEIEKKLLLLENFWVSNMATTDVENVQYIDLRFEDQVVVKRVQQLDRQHKKVSS